MLIFSVATFWTSFRPPLVSLLMHIPPYFPSFPPTTNTHIGTRQVAVTDPKTRKCACDVWFANICHMRWYSRFTKDLRSVRNGTVPRAPWFLLAFYWRRVIFTGQFETRFISARFLASSGDEQDVFKKKKINGFLNLIEAVWFCIRLPTLWAPGFMWHFLCWSYDQTVVVYWVDTLIKCGVITRWVCANYFRNTDEGRLM